MNVLATVGAAAVLTALGCAAFAAAAGMLGLRTGRLEVTRAARRALVVAAGFVTLAVATLALALLRDDFSLAYVASVSSRDMLPHMKWASLYSSQQGSLLFWAWIMSLLMAAFATLTVPRIPWCAPHAIGTCGVVLGAFLAPLVFLASPFEASAFDLADGRGLNPLLVDRGMLVHPPMLLSGLASTSIPFVLGAAALMAGRLDGAWVRAARRWALLSWLVLSVGNVLGAWWAYTVLGWGGYWGWDPVENSAILPLLPMTAFLHSMMVQERRGMLKTWNLALVFAAFALAVFGTFNVRSGLVASVHSFAQSQVGPYFLVLLALTLVVSVALLAWRAPRLRADQDFASLLSRESALVVNNYILIAIALVVLGGTLFPVFSELIEGSRITVGPPFFNQVVGPLLVALLAMIALGTVVPWRRAAPRALARRLVAPAAVALGSASALAALGVHDPFALAALSLAIALAFASAREFALGARGARARGGNADAEDPQPSWPSALLGLFERDQRRYGGYLVHIGLAVMAIAVIASNVYQQQVRASLAPGESVEVAGYRLDYAGLRGRPGVSNGIENEVLAPLTVSRGGRVVDTLQPGRRFFINAPDQPMGVVGLRSGWREDLYTFVDGWDADQTIQLQVFVNPLVAWLWIGAAVYTLGGVIAFVPRLAPLAVRRAAPAPRPSTVPRA